jgi:hypothetical protein
VTSWLEAPGLSLHVMRYEDMPARPEDTFGAAVAFLEQPADSERVARAVRLCRFEALARQEADHGPVMARVGYLDADGHPD